ncbi:MAG: NADH-quinone oxidoreductase subunit M [Dehalococcoidia bacterium]|jgi:NADH-quinone oxidoreductase subunit M|nr:NADH-quinone oxidoreductase subunit M [Dehalococcoidia bacterium]HCH35964.1 NADH-quinone oxidoreductase subunit M [Dehalococcoidia bacterium]|tara:strand:+ start:1973 stop:3481 length:1509 start_codon:yes stop_codon:yes gene_type:complete
MDRYILEILIFLPALTAALLMVTPAAWVMAIRWVSISAGALLMFASAYVFIGFDQNSSADDFQFVKEYEWLESVGIGFSLGVDGIAALMVLLTGIVSVTGLVVATNVVKQPKNYYILLFALIAGVYGTFVSIDLFFFFFFYELAIVPMYLLIAVWGSSSKFKNFSRTKEYSALKLVLMIVAASVLVWIGVITIYVQTGSLTFNMLELRELIQSSDAPLSKDFQNIVFPLMMIGFGLLAGLWPFHTWSPDGHVAAPTSVSMLHAGVLMKLGAFGIIRVGMTLLPEGFETWSLALLILGTINVVYGAVSALSQTDLKYVIGYSSVSHMGYVLMGIGTVDIIGLTGASLQMFSHGVMTALFFAIVGAIYERTHTRDTLVLNGLSARMGWASGFFIVAGLASLGLPGLSGFVSELLVFIGTFRTEPILGVLGIIGAAITATYILRLIGRVFFGPIDPKWESLKDLSPKEFGVGAFLLTPIVVVGIFPAPFLDVIRPSVDVILRGMS